VNGVLEMFFERKALLRAIRGSTPVINSLHSVVCWLQFLAVAITWLMVVGQ